MITNSKIDLEVFRRYAGLSLPRHVSYPMPTAWEDMNESDARSMVTESAQRDNPNGLSLYIHIPFCEKICRYCACNRIALASNSPSSLVITTNYLKALSTELDQLTDLIGTGRPVRQIHWGGGTPTFLRPERIEQLHEKITNCFSVAPDAEMAMEIDPRVTSTATLEVLRKMNFNRVSLGVQDFDPQVQKHVRRIQPFEMVQEILAACRDLGFKSINFDLIYGLPYQTRQTICRTIEQVIQLSPDRIAFYHYAQIPDRIATQRGLNYTKLPDSETKLQMFLDGLHLFENCGYEFIGLDHFARPDESLAVALRENTLQRTFQGMTTGKGLDQLGLGSSAISHLSGIGFLQNNHDLDAYIESLNKGMLATRRGKRLTFDDRVRQSLIGDLYCQTKIRPAHLEESFEIDFFDYFQRENDGMEQMVRDGLLEKTDTGWDVSSPLGRVLLRTVAAVFDAYLDADAYLYGDKRSFSANA